MHYADIINKETVADSGKDFYSANADGQYLGFFGAAAYEGIYVQEADGTTWHTAQSGGIGTPFLLTTDAADGTWDMWFQDNLDVILSMSIQSKAMECLTNTSTGSKRN